MIRLHTFSMFFHHKNWFTSSWTKNKQTKETKQSDLDTVTQPFTLFMEVTNFDTQFVKRLPTNPPKEETVYNVTNREEKIRK